MSGERTHRDTLALLLTMVGATCWAVVPVMVGWATLYGNGDDNALATLVGPLALGGLSGALAAATVWRAVSLFTVGVAGALCGGLAMGAFRFSADGVPAFHAIDLAIAALVAIAAIGGAVLGRRSKRAAPGLVAALITSSAYGIAGGAVAMLAALGVNAAPFMILVVFFAPVPFIVLAVYLCPDALPGSMALWVFVLAVASFAMIGVPSGGVGETVGGLLAGTLLAGMAAGGTAFVASVARHFLPGRRAPDPVPLARVH